MSSDILEMYKNKVSCSPDERAQLLASYSGATSARPGKSTAENWDSIGDQWADYFISRGVTEYKKGGLSEALSLFKSAAQSSHGNSRAFKLFQMAFAELNAESLDGYFRCFNGKKLIVAHVSCKKNIALARKSVDTFTDEKGEIANLIVVGDAKLENFKYVFDEDRCILVVPSGDTYETLTQKVSGVYLFNGFSRLNVPILKVDDDIHCSNIEFLRLDIEETFKNHDYGGGTVVPVKPFFVSTTWHMNKCADPVRNAKPNGLFHTAPYVTGPYYWLGERAVNLLSKTVLIHDDHFATEVYGYEDRAVGYVLSCYGIAACAYDMVERGTLCSSLSSNLEATEP